MGPEDKPTDDFQRIDPEDFLDYDDRYLEKGGGGGKSSGSGKGKKTLKAIKNQVKKATEQSRQTVLEKKLRRFLEAVKDRDPTHIANYLEWVNQNLSGKFTLDQKEVEVSFARAGGPGGQNVNKRETKVILHHVATGMQASSDQTRSQLENRQLALDELESRLADHLVDWRSYLGPDRRLEITLVEDLID